MYALINKCVKRPITVLMVVVAIIIVGGISLSRLAVDFYPDIEFPVISISTEYTGAGPEEVEKSVTRLIEAAVSSVSGVSDITSTSAEENSRVSVEFDWGVDLADATSDIREAVDRVRSALPDDADSPAIFKFSTSMIPVMGISLSGSDDLAALFNLADSQIIKKIEQVDGVGQASVLGGLETQVNVEVYLNRLQAYGLDINTIVSMLYTENQNIAGGETYEGVYKYILRTTGEFLTLEDMENIVVTVKNGVPIRLRDVANISYGYDDSSTIVRINQEPGIMMWINKESGKNTVSVANGVLERLEELEKTLPPGLKFEIIFNTADYIEESISGVATTAFQGAIVAIVILMIYLWNFRTVGIIAISIPLSIITTFTLMYFMGITLNIISLAGLSLGIGMMVDSSIVVLENIFYHRQNGKGKYSAAIEGSSEVATAISASTFTTVAVFLPFLFLEGMEGAIFKDLALTVTISLLTSLVVAVTIVPVLSARMISDSHNKFLKPLEDFANKGLNALDKFYENVLRKAIKHKGLLIFSSLGIVIALITVMIIFIGKEGYPTTDEGEFSVSINFPVGTRIEYTDSMVKQIEEDITYAINTINPDHLDYVTSEVRTGRGWGGASVDNRARIRVSIVDRSERDEPVQLYMEAVRAKMKAYPAEINVRSDSGGGGAMGGSDTIEIEISGEDLDKASELGNNIITAIRDIEGIRDPEIAKDDNLPEISVSINRDKAAKMGLNTATIANAIKTAFGGTDSSTMLPTGFSDDIDIFVRLQESDRANVEDVMRMMIPTPTGEMIPLSSVAMFTKTYSPTSIDRKNNMRTTTVGATVFNRSIDKVMVDIQEAIATKVFVPSDFIISYTGSYEDMQDSFKQLIQAFLLAFVLVYAIMASQFESLLAPFIIMFSVPYGAVGTLLALFLTGNTLSVVSGIGIIVLVGIVINNGIVLIDYMNQLMHTKKLPPDQSALEAGPRRLRPVMMTTLTTVVGLLPMALGISSGGELYGPLSIAVVGGLSVSTVFTLIIVPVAYSGIRNKFPLKDYDTKDAESAQEVLTSKK